MHCHKNFGGRLAPEASVHLPFALHAAGAFISLIQQAVCKLLLSAHVVKKVQHLVM